MPSEHGVGYVTGAPGGGIRSLGPAVATLAERLRAAGWRTEAFVGNHGYLAPAFGFARGFERWEMWGLDRADALARAVVARLGRRSRRPRFLFLNVMDAHAPYDPPPPYDRMFGAAGDGPPPRSQTPLTPPADARELVWRVDRYDGEIRFADEALRTVFDELKRMGRWDDALVVVTSDHGELFGEHERHGHTGEPTRALVHVPLVVKYPRGARRGVEERPVGLAAIPATVLAVLGLPPIDGAAPPLWETDGIAVAENVRPDGATRAAFDAADRMLLDVATGDRRDVRLYDLAADPGEAHPHDPAGDPAGRRLVDALGARVAAFSAAGPGRVIHPRADRRVAERLRALGYIQ
jgi:arylsulfatase A-like enzyme